jgi:hypothetical protein
VAAWRSAYAGILDETYLAGLSEARLTTFYQRAIQDRAGGHAVFVATASGTDVPGDEARPEATIVGFASGGRARRLGLAEGDLVRVVQDGGAAQLPARLEAGLPDGVARVPAGLPQTASLGAVFGTVSISKV